MVYNNYFLLKTHFLRNTLLKILKNLIKVHNLIKMILQLRLTSHKMLYSGLVKERYMNRTLVFGDIHGGLKALQELIIKANITTKDSWLIEKKHNPEWVLHGGQATIDSYAQLSKEEIETHLRFYENLTNYYIDDHNRLFLHAGFTNLHGPHREYFSKLFYWDRSLWETALSLDPTLEKTSLLYPKRLLLFHEIYIGHTPVTRIEKTVPVNAACIWNMDTGAAFKGPLTVLDIDTKQFWQSNPVHELYPNENGRN